MDLHPELFPHDSSFFGVQLQATVFDKLVSQSARVLPMSLGWIILAWHLGVTLLLLWGCWRICNRCFSESAARWAGVSLVAVLLSLPVAGTALFLMDQQLHPRALATAIILAAVVAILDRRWYVALALLAVALPIHPIMAAFGISFCLFLVGTPALRGTVALAWMPLGWIFQPVPPAWKHALDGPSYLFLTRWEWYEWLGAIAPLPILWWLCRIAIRNGSTVASRLARSLIFFGIFQLLVAVGMLSIPGLERLRPMQPMRYLHLLYFLLALLGGGILGQTVLRRHVWRWLVLFVPLAAGMYSGQRESFPGTEHLELPGRASGNSWVQAFLWIRGNTPTDALFAVDPYYLSLPGEDYHSFRALAERSVLADMVKDRVVAAQVPLLSPTWEKQTDALKGWTSFQPADFARIRHDFGVTWVMLEGSKDRGLNCPYRNRDVLVCRLD